jgi:hypothetical protein
VVNEGSDRKCCAVVMERKVKRRRKRKGREG